MSQLTSLDQTKISFMSEKIFENIQIFLDMFDIKYKNVQNYISAPCPIHGGDNPTAFCMYLDGNTLKGNWCCYTHHCEEILGQHHLVLLEVFFLTNTIIGQGNLKI